MPAWPTRKENIVRILDHLELMSVVHGYDMFKPDGRQKYRVWGSGWDVVMTTREVESFCTGAVAAVKAFDPQEEF